jgi:hypothetical protein
MEWQNIPTLAPNHAYLGFRFILGVSSRHLPVVCKRAPVLTPDLAMTDFVVGGIARAHTPPHHLIGSLPSRVVAAIT